MIYVNLSHARQYNYNPLNSVKPKLCSRKRVVNKSIYAQQLATNLKQEKPQSVKNQTKKQVFDEKKEVLKNKQQYPVFNEKQEVQKNEQEYPGFLDSKYFTEDANVNFWRNHSFFSSEVGPNLDSVEGLNKLREILLNAFVSARIFRNETSALYWSYHIARTAFFSVLGTTSLFANQSKNEQNQEMSKTEDFKSGKKRMDMTRAFNLLFFGPPAEAMVTYNQDLKNIEKGLYKLPWDMTTPQHHQYSPQFITQQSLNFIQEAVQVLTRSGNSDQQPIWLDSNLYPDYYKNTFHYQTDGWMSSKSAKIYETQTEVMFVGRQDVMQRHTLIPIYNWLKNNKQKKQLNNMHALEVAAGTGRFATFFKDNYPDIHLTVSELSPFYLEQARKNMDEWYNLRMNKNSNLKSQCMNVDFVQAAAENLPFDDGSFDIVYSTYLFHEIPYDVRVQAINEFSRVLRPGGILVVTDSYQLGDRLAFDKSISSFQNFNEPFYDSYVRLNFGEIFENAGLKCDQKIICSVTKVLSATKPDI